VLNRIKGSLLPRPRGAFFDLISANPDLWGPFWISTTLIFAMAITGNLASYYAYKGPQGGWTCAAALRALPKVTAGGGLPPWGGSRCRCGRRESVASGLFDPRPLPYARYNFNQLTLAGTAIYSYVTVMPLLLWLSLRYFEAHKRLVDIICIYGYTLAIFVPVSVLCVLPSEFLRWLLVFVGGTISGIFLLSNFHAHLSDCFPYGEGDAKRKTGSILGGMAVFHVVLLFLFKLSFFHYR